MMLISMFNWATVLIGVYLVYTGIRAVLYFREQERKVGTNWLQHSFLQTCIVITVVAAWITLARIITLIWGPQFWTVPITGLALIWLLLKPDRLRRLFEQHEGIR